MSYWIDWHRNYDSPDSSHSRRRRIVQAFLRAALRQHESPDFSLLSLCAGDGRDIEGVLKPTHSLGARVVLVEIDGELAERARSVTRSMPQVDVREGDAGQLETISDVVPVDVLLLGGVLGNLHVEEAARLIRVLPSLITERGFVVWTRGRADPDPRPTVRGWFEEAGFQELAFVGEPEPFGVGLSRLRGMSQTFEPAPSRLFTFAPYEPGAELAL